MVVKHSFEIKDTERKVKGYQRGGVVKTYTEATLLDYPCIIMETDKLEMYRVRTMKGILEGVNNTQESGEGDLYSVYIGLQGQLTKVGTIQDTKLRYLIQEKVFSDFEKKIKLSEDTEYTGMLMLALCKAELSI